MNPWPPTPYFGRSWFVELRIASKTNPQGSSFEPFKLSMQLQKPVDPQSGMTVNLMAVDQAWGQAQALTPRSWLTAFDFLKALFQEWEIWIQKEQAQLVQLKLEAMDGQGWDLNQKGLFYQTAIRLQSSDTKDRSPRKALLTSQQPFLGSELRDFESRCLQARREDLSKILQLTPQLTRIEILDFFEQFVEYDFTK